MPARHARKRTPDQILRDRTEIARRYCRGELQSVIARDLGVSQQQVSYDLAAIRKEWRQARLEALDEQTAQEVAKIDELERTYWNAYLAGRQPMKKTVQHAELPNRSTDGKPVPTRAVVTTEERLGDPRYLAGVQWCISERCRIFGLYTPVKANVNLRSLAEDAARVAGLDPADVLAEAERIMRGTWKQG